MSKIKKNTTIDRLLNGPSTYIKESRGPFVGNTSMPTIQTYKQMQHTKYTLVQLRSFAKYYKLQQSGNKAELMNRIYNYLYYSYYAVKIQKCMRRYLVQKYISMHGPAAFQRSLCTNTTDFISMEPLEEIHFHQFISYKDADGFIYGFDLVSLHNLFLKSPGEMKNPYNRSLFSHVLINNIRSILRIGKMLNIEINLNCEDLPKSLTNKKTTELRALALFQAIDTLGNYSNADWFLSLNRNELHIFIYELVDIWNYRAKLSIETKINICPPFGNPFYSIRMDAVLHDPDLLNVQNMLLTIMENLVYRGIDHDSKCLGAYYILGTLTLVNATAATSMPWLFESFAY